jgi:uncharacterized protein
VLWWVATALVILYLLRVERRQLSSIGLSPPSLQDLVLAILAAILMIAGAVVIRDGIFPVIHAQVKTTEIMRYFASPYWYRLIVVSRAACAEETLLRAFPFERLAEMTGKPVFAAVVTWAAFTASHLRTWGWAYLILSGFHGIVLTLLYLRRRNLPSNVIAHWLVDAAFLLTF